MAQTPALHYSDDGAIDYTPVAAVTAGDVVEIGTRAYVALSDIAANAKGSLATEGVFKIPKASGAISAGDVIYWDNNGNPNSGTAGTGACTGTSSGNTVLGRATADALTGDTYTYVELMDAALSTALPDFAPEAVAAAGSVQGDAGAVGAATGFVLASGADATKGIILPAASAGKCIVVKNNAAAVLKVYPATGDAINAIAANSALSMASLTSAMFVAYDATTWYTVPLLPS